MANISFDGAQYNDLKGVRFRESPNSVFYDTTLQAQEAATASDIKAGKKAWANGILVEGTREDVSINTKDKNIIANGTYYAADDDCVGYRKVTVNVQTGQNEFNPQDVKTVTIGARSGSIEPSPPYTHMERVDFTVSSNVDSNIRSGNIKSGVSILGVMGTYIGSVSSIEALYFRNNRYGVSTANRSIKVYYSSSKLSADNYLDVDFKLKRKLSTATSWTTVTNPITVIWDSDLGCVVFTYTYGSSLNYLYQITAQGLSGSVWGTDIIFVLTTSKTPQDYINEGDEDFWHKCYVSSGYNYAVDDASQSNTPSFSANGGNDITGTFTPSASQNVSGGHVDISTDGFAKAVYLYAVDDVTGGVDEGAPLRIAIFALTETPGTGAEAFLAKINKNGSGGIVSMNSISTTAPYSSGYLNGDATNNLNDVVIADGYVRFKTYGMYGFRAGKTYRYHIYM